MAEFNEQGFLTALGYNEIFVFGSNLAGRHGAGAALQARKQFGAVLGQGEGLQGMSYAYPTLDANLKKLSHGHLLISRYNFYDCAINNPDLTFIVTKVGCGLAGFDEQYMREFFVDPTYYHPPNVILPDDWNGESSVPV